MGGYGLIVVKQNDTQVSVISLVIFIARKMKKKNENFQYGIYKRWTDEVLLKFVKYEDVIQKPDRGRSSMLKIDKPWAFALKSSFAVFSRKWYLKLWDFVLELYDFKSVVMINIFFFIF